MCSPFSLTYAYFGFYEILFYDWQYNSITQTDPHCTNVWCTYMFVINSVKAENIDVFLLHPIYPSFFQCAFQKLALEP